MIRSHWTRLAYSSLLGLVLSLVFFFLAALPIRYMRLTFGRKTFILVSVVSTLALALSGIWEWTFRYASLCLLIGVYRELEEKKFSIFLSSCGAVLSTLGAYAVTVFGVLKLSSFDLQTFLSKETAPLLQQLKQIPQLKGVAMDDVIWLLPSAVTISMMFILFVSLTLKRATNSTKDRLALKMFRLPDWVIWCFIGSLGATFIPLPQAWMGLVGKNILTVTLGAYFFQGLGVFTVFLDRFSIWGLWRMLAYFLVFINLLPLIIVLGILDYWFDFRIQGLTGSTKKI